MSNNKRLDLQGIRGQAILAVLGFHFYPNLVANGYFGVDQFFVLSGFLMCMLLSKSDSSDIPKMIKHFYIRRLKRILPLYQLIILLATMSIFFCFPVTSIEVNTMSAERAMLFMSNRLESDEQSYMEMLTHAINIFTHTWSLSVEVQFYFMVPLIFLLPLKNVSFSIIAVVSFLYFNYLPKDVAFVSVFGRVWQFLIGMLAYLLTSSPPNEESKNLYQLLANEDYSKTPDEQEIKPNRTHLSQLIDYALIIVLVGIVFCPITLPAEWARPIVTIITGLLIALSPETNIFLSNRLITYIGNISYSLYLVHWPIYSFWKINRNNNQLELIGFLLLSIIISIVIFETFEKWYTRSTNQTNLLLTTILVLSTLTILHREQIVSRNSQRHVNMDEVTDNMTLDDAARLNKKWTVGDSQSLFVKTCNYLKSDKMEEQDWCNQTGLNPRNTNKIMIIGNSYAANHGRLVYEECFNQANSMWLQHSYICEPLYISEAWGDKKCNQSIPDVLEHLKSYKPDYLFHLTRYIYTGDGDATNLENDVIYQKMLNHTRTYIEHVSKKFYILNALPTIYMENVVEIVNQIKSGKPLVEIDKWLRYTEKDSTWLTARKRYEQLVKDCGEKCELIDYYDLFHRNDTDTFRFFDDRGFSYLTGFMHLTPHGLEYVRHVYTDICNKM